MAVETQIHRPRGGQACRIRHISCQIIMAAYGDVRFAVPLCPGFVTTFVGDAVNMLGDVRHRGTVIQRSIGFIKVQAFAIRNAKKDKLIIISLADILDDGDIFIIFIEAPVLFPSMQRDI